MVPWSGLYYGTIESVSFIPYQNTLMILWIATAWVREILWLGYGYVSVDWNTSFEEKRRLWLNRVNPLKSPQPDLLDKSILFSFLKLFFDSGHRFIDQLTITTEPIVPNARLQSVFTHFASGMQIYWNKRKRLLKKRVQLPRDWFGDTNMSAVSCFGTPIWPP